jgi:hypothetical protein
MINYNKYLQTFFTVISACLISRDFFFSIASPSISRAEAVFSAISASNFEHSSERLSTSFRWTFKRASSSFNSTWASSIFSKPPARRCCWKINHFKYEKRIF